ncbi:hypothetical protein OG895_21130 [Streptomyces sp. NBC_00201]|uniref:hypothetical protein n=1 Tax=unclassified Streptomyces TaxID=2593676 RepID=UPI002251CEE8|nr:MULTISPECIES: hypothetical protein [unclassified Streptomyces]MCX5055472.1 hypothetical protein [Streptomyces sp. NBC_00452]MCX5247682.1 hypothetical protein [Streptomyces sp. NBC_00201]
MAIVTFGAPARSTEPTALGDERSLFHDTVAADTDLRSLGGDTAKSDRRPVGHGTAASRSARGAVVAS